MKWLQANPVGLALAGLGGFLILVGLVIGILWTMPVAVDIDENVAADAAGADKVVVAADLEPLAKYEVINQRPVFNESRLPVIEEDEEPIVEEEVVNPVIAVTGAPDVRLTGIIITPGMKLASLTPNDANIDSVMAYEGDALTGEFQGWQVSKVDARKVMLESLDGQTLQLELEVHDSKIQEPIKPVAPPKEVAQAQTATEAGQAQPSDAGAEGDDEAPSRAEQIRQRIAERREELRLEQEKQQQSQNRRAARAASATKNNAYQNAIRARINSQRKDKSSDDNE